MYLVYNNLTKSFEPPYIAEYLYKGGVIRKFTNPELVQEIKIVEEREINGVLCGIADVSRSVVWNDSYGTVKETEIEIDFEITEAEEPTLEELEGARQQSREQEALPPWED